MEHDEMIWNDETAYTEAVEAAVIERKRPFKQSVWPGRYSLTWTEHN